MSGYNSGYYPDQYWPLEYEYFPEFIIISIPGCATVIDSLVDTATVMMSLVDAATLASMILLDAAIASMSLVDTSTATTTLVYSAAGSIETCTINLPIEVETVTELWKWDDDSDIDWG